MQRRMKVMLISVGILFGSIFLYKAIVGFIIQRSMANASKVVTVSAMKIDSSSWQPQLTVSGSLRAIRGVNVTTELAGMVQTIYFQPGARVKKDDLLVQLNADSDIAKLHALEANVELANITYLRDKAQYAIRAVSKQALDNDAANLKMLKAQVDEQKAIVAKKTIRAPFSGRLGINQINPGQYLNPGDSVVTLQSLNPVYADFFVPQQQLGKLELEEQVKVISNTFTHKTFSGKITTINPEVDVTTRNIKVEATIENPEQKLLPGMFVDVTIITGKPSLYLTVPQTAISYNPYGNLVYTIENTGKMQQGKPVLIARQHFVKTGEARGEQIKILQGLKKGDMIVTSGQLKLKNGSQIAIDNSIVPSDNSSPNLKNNHKG